MDGTTAKPSEQDFGPAGRYLPAHLVFWTVAALVLALDLWSKRWAFAQLGSTETRTIIDGTLEFRRSLNAGAVFGSFSGRASLFVIASILALGFVLYLFTRSARKQYGFHVALGLVLAGALGNLYDRTFIIADIVHVQTHSGPPEMIIGSAIEDTVNQTVRVGDWPDANHARTFRRSEVTIRQQGVVRDFIKFVPRFPAWVPKLAGREIWPWVFNIADSALVCGVGVLLVSGWFERKSPKPPA